MREIDNKYKHTYYRLIKSRKKLCRSKSEQHYFERHHIIPKSCGGDNSETNLVLLTAREHFIAHLLLPKFTIGECHHKMVRARWYMCKLAKKKSGVCYEKYKLAFKDSMSGCNNPNFGNPNNFLHSEESKQKMSKSHTGKTLTAEHRNNMSLARKGKPGKLHSEESKQKMSKSHTGKTLTEQTKQKVSRNSAKFWKGKRLSDEHRAKISETRKKNKTSAGNNNPMFGIGGMKGKSHSSATKAIMSENMKRIHASEVDLTCPYCNKKGGRIMKRWHFDNCKHK